MAFTTWQCQQMPEILVLRDLCMYYTWPSLLPNAFRTLRELPVSKGSMEAEGTRLLQVRRGNLVCGQTRLNKM